MVARAVYLPNLDRLIVIDLLRMMMKMMTTKVTMITMTVVVALSFVHRMHCIEPEFDTVDIRQMMLKHYHCRCCFDVAPTTLYH